MGINIDKVDPLDIKINQLQGIKDQNKRLQFADKLVHSYPNHPKPHLELLKCFHEVSHPLQFDQANNYAKILQKWLIKTGIAELNMEFIKPATVIGSLGNHYCIESLIKANQSGLRESKKIFLLLPENSQLRNSALFSYFEPHLNLIQDRESIQALKNLEPILTLHLGIGLLLNNRFPFLDIGRNLAEIECNRRGLGSALFELSDLHHEMGEQALKKLGLPSDAWYVTLHVREPGYRGENRQNTTENWRNSNPLDYIKACQVITKAGGWVFRMGDPSMTPFPSMPRVIDYALNDIRSDWMDVFLGATSRFTLATGSGYYHIPSFFGVPYILTNYPGFVPYYGMRNKDLYVPRWLKNIQTNELISFEEYMSPAVSTIWSEKSFYNAGLHWIENTPEELEVATIEMLERTDPNLSSGITENHLQKKFKTLAEACGYQYGNNSVKSFASISRDFIEKHSDLL